MTHGRRAAALAAVVLTMPVLAAPRLAAQGIGVNTQSACNSGRNEAVTGDPCADGSAIFYNPAALAFQPSVVGVGASIVHNSHTFVFDNDPSTVYKRGPENPLVPQAWVQYRGGERWSAGAGVWAPYGFTLKWPVTFPGRYTGYNNTVKAIYLQPTVAYQLVPKRLSVGAGLDVVFGQVDIFQRVDMSAQTVPGTGGKTFNNFGIPQGTDFAEAELKGSATGIGGHFAALLKLTDALQVGARYMMNTKVDFKKGTATFTPVSTGLTAAAGNPFGLPAGTPLDALFTSQFTGTGLLANQAATTQITFPAMALVGVAWKAMPSVELTGDWQWTQWSKWDAFPLKFANHPETDSLFVLNQNTNTFRLGVDYSGAMPGLDLRAGWGYNKPAETDVAVSPLLPEAARDYYSAGLSYKLTSALTADGFFQYVKQAARRGRVLPLDTRNVTPDQVNVGLYSAKAFVTGINLRYTFGPAR